MAGSPNARTKGGAHYPAGAALWGFGFAGISFYWAAGGSFGAATVGRQITSYAAATPGFYIVLWVDAAVKALLGVVALALIYPSWQRALPGGTYLPAVAWIAGLLMVIYGGVELTVTGISSLLMVAGILPTTSSVDWVGIVGHLALWDPYWLLGGILFLLAAESAGIRFRQRIARWLLPA